MRAFVFAAITAAAAQAACPPAAAPTSQDRSGGAIKCGTPGAMPVGWTASPAQRFERELREPSGLSPSGQWELVGLLVGLFGLIALMPRFDGSAAGDWDRQEGDEED
jgi:hypothetical protein